MRYQEHPVRPALAAVVERIWTLEGHADALAGEPQVVLPDGRGELILHFGEAFERLDADGPTRQASMLLAGQLTGQLVLRPTGAIGVLGVRFHPHGGAALLRVPQHELAGLTLGVEEVSVPLSRAMAEARACASGPIEAVAVVQQALVGLVDPSGLDPRVAHVVAAIDRHRGRVSVDRLATDAGITRRHLERQFQVHVGVSPKRLARIARFQHALRYLTGESGDVQPVPQRGALTAAACGYADQAHFVRDFRDLAGCPPTEHLLNRGLLTGFFSSSHQHPSTREPKHPST